MLLQLTSENWYRLMIFCALGKDGATFIRGVRVWKEIGFILTF